MNRDGIFEKTRGYVEGASNCYSALRILVLSVGIYGTGRKRVGSYPLLSEICGYTVSLTRVWLYATGNNQI